MSLLPIAGQKYEAVIHVEIVFIPENGEKAMLELFG